MSRPSVTRAALGMGAVTAASRAFGFVRVLVIAAVLGTTYLGNAFQGTNSFSNVLFELLAAGALSAVLVPSLVALVDRGERAEAERVTGALLGAALLVLVPVALVGVLAAPWLARVLLRGVDDPAVAEQQRELATYLLRWFVPQIVLYAFGAVATAALYASRRFAITAAAPIGNTIVMVGALLAFRAAAGAEPGLDLSGGERLLLAIAGTGGVLAFVGTLVVASHRAGFRLRPRRPTRDPALVRILRLAGWGVLLHAGAGLLLGGAIVLGNEVEGGVVAYQVAWVFFLAPYAILAQPVHTAILPELASGAARADLDGFGADLRWALDTLALVVVPVSAALVALALPFMRVVVFGEAAGAGVSLIAAGMAALAAGLVPYSAFFLLSRGFFAIGDSRTPALVAIGSAVLGVVVMGVLAPLTSGAARVAALGAGHSAAYALGALGLLVALRRRTGIALRPTRFPIALAVAVPLAVAMWSGWEALDVDGRVETGFVGLGLVALAGALYLLALRTAGVQLPSRPSRDSTAPGPPRVGIA
ncbi:MAG TPA: lipid II flippase MurJ [Acidimicrobiia bacterium]|nr:lipid II flippase MurJ [Acidimicrobiia bacterium]